MADQDSNKMNLPLALSSSIAHWLDLHHHATRPTLSTSPRNYIGASVVNLREAHTSLNSSPRDHEDVSISAFNHSSLTIDEPSHQFVRTPSSNYIIREPRTDNNSHLWSQLLLSGVEGTHEMSRDEMGENLLNAHSLKFISDGMFEPSACGEYLRKLDSHHNDKSTEINGDRYPDSDTNEFFTNNLDKQSIKSNAGYNSDSNLIEKKDLQRSLNMLSSSNLVSSWSIAPPDLPQMMHYTVPHPFNDNVPSVHQYLQLDTTNDQTKQSFVCQWQLFDMAPTSILECENFGLNQRRQEKDESGQKESAIPATLFPIMAPFISTTESGHWPVGGNWRPRDTKMLSHNGYTTSKINPLNNSCSRFSSKALPSSASLMDAKKQQEKVTNSSMNKGNERGLGAYINETKKKRSEDAFQSCSSLKKPKSDNIVSNPSTASSSAKSANTRTPKGKVEAEKLSALQQIVSPYGKIDTASVLQEAIEFIRRHQENVQMLSKPYVKSGVNKLQEAWGSLDRKGERNKLVLDLKSKGLCVVPVSSIPQEIKEDNFGLDYWPTYRGCMYR